MVLVVTVWGVVVLGLVFNSFFSEDEQTQFTRDPGEILSRLLSSFPTGWYPVHSIVPVFDRMASYLAAMSTNTLTTKANMTIFCLLDGETIWNLKRKYMWWNIRKHWSIQLHLFQSRCQVLIFVGGGDSFWEKVGFFEREWHTRSESRDVRGKPLKICLKIIHFETFWSSFTAFLFVIG